MEFEITKSCDSCSKNRFNPSCVPVVNKEISYDDFFGSYMRPNLPCVIKDVTSTWEASSKWLNDHTINLEYLKRKYGSCDVTIYNCNDRYFNSQRTESCKFASFLDGWGCERSNSQYLKDWHLKNTFKDDNFYQVPVYFASDWLNEFLVENGQDDYRFVYMGRADTWYHRERIKINITRLFVLRTPFHADVFNSFSWSANVCGRKRWILFPPGEENSMRDSLNNQPYDISLAYRERPHLEVVQNQGEAIFVPSGWHHQVWNLEETISVNHNWVNGCNIMNMWRALVENLDRVKREIEDCRDMEGFLHQCQVVLKASFGMDFFRFFDLLEFIVIRRLTHLQNKQKEILFHGHVLGTNHAIFDLKAAKEVLEELAGHDDIAELFATSKSHPEKLLEQMRQEEQQNMYYKK
jgi:hypothetical protein